MIPTATWSDALDHVGLTGLLPRLRRRAGRLPVAGRVITVAEEVGGLGSAQADAFGIEHILSVAQPGQLVLIRQTGDGAPASAIGGLAALAAQRHGLEAIVIDGACRDVAELEAIGLTVLSRDVTPASGRRRVQIVGVNVPLLYDGLTVQPGDMVVADATGVVVLPTLRLDELLAVAEERARADAAAAAALRG